MGTLRLRHCELLDALGRLLAEQASSPAKSKSLQSFIRTCAAVNYSPPVLPILVEKHLNLDEKPSDDTTALMDLKNRIDLVWSLVILDQANANHLVTVLNQEAFQVIQSEWRVCVRERTSLIDLFRRSDELEDRQCFETTRRLFVQYAEVEQTIPQAHLQYRSTRSTVDTEECQCSRSTGENRH